jgi:hypothetical protein
VVVGDAAHDGQPQPGAAGASVPALIQAHEGLEDLRGQRGIDAGAIVGDLQQIVVPVALCRGLPGWWHGAGRCR